MARTCGILVVGSGAVAVATALVLLERTGEEVWLLCPDHLGADASARSPGLLHRYHELAMLSDLAAEGLAAWRRWADEGAAVGLRPAEVLVSAPPPLCSPLPGRALRVRERGHALEVLEGEALARRAPAVRFAEGSVGILEPDAALLPPRRALETLARHGEGRGLRVLQDEVPTALRVRGGRVVGVDTGRGRIEAGWTVLTDSPASAALLPQPPRAAWPARERAFHLLDGGDALDDLDLVLVDEKSGLRWVPLPGGWWRRDGAHPPQSDPLLPPLARATVWCGGTWSYTEGVDGRPLIGPVARTEGLLAAVGLGERDFALAPAAGRILAGWMEGGGPADGVAALLDPRRFLGALPPNEERP